MTNSTNSHPLTGKYVSIESLNDKQRQNLINALISTVIKFASAAEICGSVQFNLRKMAVLEERLKTSNPANQEKLKQESQRLTTTVQFAEMEMGAKLDTALSFMTEALEMLYTPQTRAIIRKANK